MSEDSDGFWRCPRCGARGDREDIVTDEDACAACGYDPDEGLDVLKNVPRDQLIEELKDRDHVGHQAEAGAIRDIRDALTYGVGELKDHGRDRASSTVKVATEILDAGGVLILESPQHRKDIRMDESAGVPEVEGHDITAGWKRFMENMEEHIKQMNSYGSEEAAGRSRAAREEIDRARAIVNEDLRRPDRMRGDEEIEKAREFWEDSSDVDVPDDADDAYHQRNLAVLTLIRELQLSGYDVGWRTDPDVGEEWPVVFVQTDTMGELSWHMPRDLVDVMEWIPERQDVEFSGDYDTHEKLEDYLEKQADASGLKGAVNAVKGLIYGGGPDSEAD